MHVNFDVTPFETSMAMQRINFTGLYLVMQLVAKESKANESNAGIRRFFVLFLDKKYISGHSL